VPVCAINASEMKRFFIGLPKTISRSDIKDVSRSHEVLLICKIYFPNNKSIGDNCNVIIRNALSNPTVINKATSQSKNSQDFDT
jgi:hypothetical protein